MPRAKSSATSVGAGSALLEIGVLLTTRWSGRKIEHELPGDGLDHPALMAEGDSVAGGERSGFEQGILHPRNLLLHGFERLPDHRRTHLAGAQVTHFLDLQEIEKRIALGRGYQSGFFPSC